MSTQLSTQDGLEPDSGFASASSIGRAASDLRTAATEKARELVHTAETKAAMLKERAVESAQQFREVAGQKASALKSNANEQWQETRIRAKELQITGEEYVRQNPTKCVLGALGVGFLIGLIVRR